jgi:hypothetical protein
MQSVQIVLTCDLDNDPAEQTVVFGYEGREYAFELCERHIAEYNETMESWVSAARLNRPGSPQRSPRRQASVASREDLSAIRAWARENGYEVNDRGRIPSEIRDAYDTAQAAPVVEKKSRSRKDKELVAAGVNEE